MPSLFEQAKQFRRLLLQRDAAAAERLTLAYGQIHTDIQRRVSDLTAEIEAARARGETVDAHWLRQRDRLSSLLTQVESEVGRFSALARHVIVGEQGALAALAQSHAASLVIAARGPSLIPSFARLPTAAVEDVVGFLSPGRPLHALLDRLAGQAAERVRTKLVTAVATGQTPRRVASEIREAMGGNLTDALAISRTSMVGAYRASTLRTYQANSDVVRAWRWVAAKSTRTCLVCLLLDGRVFPLSKPMPAHFNCRCLPVPVLDGQAWRAQTGARWFDTLSDADKRGILGPRAFEAYARGEVSLADFLGWKKDAHLGEVGYRQGLREAVASGAAGVRPKKIVAEGSTVEGDAHLVRRVGQELARNPVARRAYERMQKQGVDVRLNFGVPPAPDEYGEFDANRHVVRVFMQNTIGARETVSTIVHESRHVMRALRGRNMYSRAEEVRARLLEFVYTYGRRPTLPERNALRALVNRLYHGLPEE